MIIKDSPWFTLELPSPQLNPPQRRRKTFPFCHLAQAKEVERQRRAAARKEEEAGRMIQWFHGDSVILLGFHWDLTHSPLKWLAHNSRWFFQKTVFQKTGFQKTGFQKIQRFLASIGAHGLVGTTETHGRSSCKGRKGNAWERLYLW